MGEPLFKFQNHARASKILDLQGDSIIRFEASPPVRARGNGVAKAEKSCTMP
jgi:hypothetical protein